MDVSCVHAQLARSLRLLRPPSAARATLSDFPVLPLAPSSALCPFGRNGQERDGQEDRRPQARREEGQGPEDGRQEEARRHEEEGGLVNLFWPRVSIFLNLAPLSTYLVLASSFNLL